MSAKQTETPINLETWPRQSQYKLFKDFASPHFSITTRVDVSGIMHAKSVADVSPFNAMLYCIMTAINKVPEFRTRFRSNDGQISVIEHNIIHPSVTVPIEDDGFAFCEIPFDQSWQVFNNNCETAITEGKAQVELDEKTIDSDHWIFMSCLPWLDFTNMQHPLKGPEDCVPRFAWGKIVPKNTMNETFEVAVNLTAHHALADGLHMARFFNKLQAACKAFKTETTE